jgi:2-methylisocitrate lyase-like PEP mutase family enzyme
LEERHRLAAAATTTTGSSPSYIRPLRILETHSGLSGLIAEHAVGATTGRQFDGMWSSSLTASASCGMPDIEAVDTSARLGLVQETLNVTTKPMIYDGDTGGTSTVLVGRTWNTHIFYRSSS